MNTYRIYIIVSRLFSTKYVAELSIHEFSIQRNWFSKPTTCCKHSFLLENYINPLRIFAFKCTYFCPETPRNPEKIPLLKQHTVLSSSGMAPCILPFMMTVLLSIITVACLLIPFLSGSKIAVGLFTIAWIK